MLESVYISVYFANVSSYISKISMFCFMCSTGWPVLSIRHVDGNDSVSVATLSVDIPNKKG